MSKRDRVSPYRYQTKTDLLDAFAFVARHVCCELAGRLLVPPHPSTKAYRLGPEGGSVSLRRRVPYWHIVHAGLVEILFCPFCGERLEQWERSEERVDDAIEEN